MAGGINFLLSDTKCQHKCAKYDCICCSSNPEPFKLNFKVIIKLHLEYQTVKYHVFLSLDSFHGENPLIIIWTSTNQVLTGSFIENSDLTFYVICVWNKLAHVKALVNTEL